MATLKERFREQWGDLLSAFGERIVKPTSRPTATFYLLLAVALFGGLGLWITQLMAAFGQAKPRDLAMGVATYAVPIVATSVGDLLLDREANPGLRFVLFAVATLALLVSAFLTYHLVFSVGDEQTVTWRALIVCVAPVWATWWLINGVDQRFLMNPSPNTTIGGDAGGRW